MYITASKYITGIKDSYFLNPVFKHLVKMVRLYFIMSDVCVYSLIYSSKFIRLLKTSDKDNT